MKPYYWDCFYKAEQPFTIRKLANVYNDLSVSLHDTSEEADAWALHLNKEYGAQRAACVNVVISGKLGDGLPSKRVQTLPPEATSNDRS